MKFATKGYRKRSKPGYGIHYRSDGDYKLYNSDQVGGVKLRVVRWLAIWIGPDGERLISRHRVRRAAERSCERHERGRKRKGVVR